MTEETQILRSEFGLVWQAVERWMPATYSHVCRAGILSDRLRGSGQILLASDLTHLLIPGLAALGIEACLTPLTSTSLSLEGRSPDSNAILLFGFAASLEFVPPEEIDDSTLAPEDTDPQITAQSLYPDETLGGLYRQGTVSHPMLRSGFPHALCLHRAGTKGLGRNSIQATVHRWLAWYAAYPQRAPREADLTDPACGLAAAFLLEAVGTRHDFVSNRLRYAARCFEAAQIERAYSWLLEAGIAIWQLPSAAAEALLTPPGLPFSDVLRRELIYFPRAGTLPLKILATRRLTHERHHPDARKTLHQLCFDADRWIRAAACPASS